MSSIDLELPRVDAPCPHASSCGGCAFQSYDLEALGAWKRERVIDALKRQGLSPTIAPIEMSPPQSRRRARFAAARTKKGVKLGFYRAKSHEVIDIERCLLISPRLLEATQSLREIAGVAAPRSRPIQIHVTETISGLDIAITEAKELDLDLRSKAAAWVETHDVARLSWNGEPVAQSRPPQLHFGRAVVAPPPGAFLQPTADGEARLASHVIRALKGAKRVADLFAGCGTFALRIAEIAEVLAVEGDSDLVKALDAGWRKADGLKKTVSLARDLFRRPMRPDELKTFDAVVFDPPRQGAEAQAEQLIRFDGATIIGVSCDASSFARDAAIIERGHWRLASVTPVDQFLWSPHVELVGLFQRA